MSDEEQGAERGRRLAALIAAGTALVALLAAVAFILVQSRAPADRFAACREVQVAGGQKLGGPFELTAQDGTRMSEADILKGGPALIYFGYTFCPDICPLDMARNVEAVDLLAEKGVALRPVFVTVDPARDTVEALGDYAEAMHPDMIALTGSEEDLAPVKAAFGVVAQKEEGGDPDYYLVSHTTLSYLALPGEGVVALFSRRIGGAELAERAACFINAAE